MALFGEKRLEKAILVDTIVAKGRRNWRKFMPFIIRDHDAVETGIEQPHVGFIPKALLVLDFIANLLLAHGRNLLNCCFRLFYQFEQRSRPARNRKRWGSGYPCFAFLSIF